VRLEDEKYTIKPKCDMLRDQDLYIMESGAKVPLGHACYNDANFQTETHYICKECSEMFKVGEGYKITVGLGSVKTFPEFIKKMFNPK